MSGESAWTRTVVAAMLSVMGLGTLVLGALGVVAVASNGGKSESGTGTQVEVHLINRPDERPLGAGEGSQGPTVAAIANAIFDATGARLRQIPFTPERVRIAMQAAGTGSVVSRNNFNVYLHWLARRLRAAGWQRWTIGIHHSAHVASN